MKVRITFALLSVVFLLSLMVVTTTAQGKKVKGADARKDVKKRQSRRKSPLPWVNQKKQQRFMALR